MGIVMRIIRLCYGSCLCCIGGIANTYIARIAQAMIASCCVHLIAGLVPAAPLSSMRLWKSTAQATMKVSPCLQAIDAYEKMR